MRVCIYFYVNCFFVATDSQICRNSNLHLYQHFWCLFFSMDLMDLMDLAITLAPPPLSSRGKRRDSGDSLCILCMYYMR